MNSWEKKNKLKQYYLFSMFTIYFYLEARLILKQKSRYESPTYELSSPVEFDFSTN